MGNQPKLLKDSQTLVFCTSLAKKPLTDHTIRARRKALVPRRGLSFYAVSLLLTSPNIGPTENKAMFTGSSSKYHNSGQRRWIRSWEALNCWQIPQWLFWVLEGECFYAKLLLYFFFPNYPYNKMQTKPLGTLCTDHRYGTWLSAWRGYNAVNETRSEAKTLGTEF